MRIAVGIVQNWAGCRETWHGMAKINYVNIILKFSFKKNLDGLIFCLCHQNLKIFEKPKNLLLLQYLPINTENLTSINLNSADNISHPCITGKQYK